MNINTGNARPSLDLSELIFAVNVRQDIINTSFTLSTLEEVGTEDGITLYSAQIDRILEKAGVKITVINKINLQSAVNSGNQITCDWIDLQKEDIAVHIEGARLSLDGEEVEASDFCADADVIEAFYNSAMTSINSECINRLLNKVIPYNTLAA